MFFLDVSLAKIISAALCVYFQKSLYDASPIFKILLGTNKTHFRVIKKLIFFYWNFHLTLLSHHVINNKFTNASIQLFLFKMAKLNHKGKEKK